MNGRLRLETKIAACVTVFLLVVAVSISPFGALQPDRVYRHPVGYRGYTLYLSDFQRALAVICLWGAAGTLLATGILKMAADRTG